MSRNYVYAVALAHPLTTDHVPIEAFERVCVELPNIVHTLFAINRDTTRGYWLNNDLFVRTTDPIFYAYQAQQFRIQFLNGDTLFSYRIQFERRPLPARIPPRRRSFFELMPWERDGPPLYSANDRGPSLPAGSSPAMVAPTSTAQQPGTPRPTEVPSIGVARLESLLFEPVLSPESSEKNEGNRPTLRCPV